MPVIVICLPARLDRCEWIKACLFRVEKGVSHARVHSNFFVDRLAMIMESLGVFALCVGKKFPDKPVVQLQNLIDHRRLRVEQYGYQGGIATRRLEIT